MKLALTGCLAALIAALAGAACAARIDIQHAAARVTVIPEARNDIAVSVVRQNPRMRITMTRMGDTVIVDGGLGFRGPSCTNFFGRRGVHVWGMGFIPYDQLPQIVVRTPLDANVSASGAVYGVVDRSQSLALANSGCGDWLVANVAGPMRVHLAGSGDVRAGSAGSAEVHISGSSDVFLREVRAGLDTATSGSGDVRAASIDGPLHVRLAGSGDLVAPAGQVSDMVVGIAGSGDVHFGGVARSLEANVVGSGDVTVGRVTGPVVKHVAGSGDVNVGS
ncbi:MAG: GIN domain-containing protein [Caulobacteraceae bacterium]